MTDADAVCAYDINENLTKSFIFINNASIGITHRRHWHNSNNNIVINEEYLWIVSNVVSINYKIMSATKVVGTTSTVHDSAQVMNVREMSTSEAIYYHSCPFGSSAGNRLNINNYEILAACHTPASLDPAPPFRFDPFSSCREGYKRVKL